MLTCDGNENCEQKLNKVLYWETPLGDSALIIQPIAHLYTTSDWRCAPWRAESSQRRSHTNVYKSWVVQKYKFNDFCRNIYETVQEYIRLFFHKMCN